MNNFRDKLTQEERSIHMGKIRSKNTKPELVVRQFLHSRGFRYRLHENKLPGKPDIKLAKYKTVIFINGCFWHGHTNCRIYQMPKSRVAFWNKKIKNNMERDTLNILALKKMGWKVLVLWECELKPTRRENALTTLITRIQGK